MTLCFLSTIKIMNERQKYSVATPPATLVFTLLLAVMLSCCNIIWKFQMYFFVSYYYVTFILALGFTPANSLRDLS